MRSPNVARPRSTAEDLPLRGRYTQLVPPPPQFLDELYEMAATNQIPWQWGGPETPDAFRESLWRGVLVMYAIQELRTGRCVGLLKAENANLYHGYAYMTMMIHPAYRMRVWPLEATILFGNYLFRKFNLHNLYAETASSYFAQFESGRGTAFEVEGCLRDRVLVNGHREDLYILTFKRERALTEWADGIARITEGVTARRPTAVGDDGDR